MDEAANEFLEKGTQVFVGGELKGDASQTARIWTGNDGQSGDCREYQASYEVTARTVKFLGKRKGNEGASLGDPPPGGEDDDILPF